MSVSRPETSSVEARFADHVRRNAINWQRIILDLDKVQTGILTHAQMRRFFEATSFAVTDSEFRYISSRYDERHGGFINYRSFLSSCKLSSGGLNESFEQRPSTTPQTNAIIRTSISAMSESKYEDLMAQIRRTLHDNKASIRESFLDFDKSKTGVITSEQFRRGLERCSVSIPEDKFHHLIFKYESKRLPKHVEWISFCDELESTPQSHNTPSKPRTPNGFKENFFSNQIMPDVRRVSVTDGTDKAAILRKINEAMLESDDSIRIHFLELDKSGDGILAANDFLSVFETLRIPLSKTESDLLIKTYSTLGRGMHFINYNIFLNELNSTAKAVFFSKEQSESIESRLRESLYGVSRQELLHSFKSFDHEGVGHVTSARFKQVLDRHEIVFPDEEIDHILQKHSFQVGDNVYYVAFVEKLCSAVTIHPLDGQNGRASSAPAFTYGASQKALSPSNCSSPTNGSPFDGMASPEVRQAISRVQTTLMESKARITEFLRDYDRLRSGLITEMQFRRGIDLSGVRLNESELVALIEFYQGKNHRTVQWMRFCDDVDSVFTVKNLERRTRVPGANGRSENKFQGSGARAAQTDAIVKNVLNRLQEVISRQRIIPLPPFQDFDRLHCRRVTVTQFQQSLAILGLSVKEVEMAAIVKKYGVEIDGLMTVKYVEFLDDLKSADKAASDHAHLAKLEQILREKILQNVGGSGHLRKAFRFFDRDATGHITEIQFGNVCRQLGLNLTDEEVKGLMSRYDIDQDGTIDYHEFIDRLLPKDYGYEKAPTACVVKQVEIPKYLPRTINTAITELPLLLAKMKAMLLSKNIRLQDFLADYDFHHRGLISREQFQRGINAAGLRLEEEEVKVLLTHYASKEVDLIRWTQFADDIYSGLNPKDLERNPRKEVKYVHPRDLIIESLGGSPSENLTNDTRQVMKRIGEEVMNRRIFDDVETLFRDFDHHHVRQVMVENFKKVMKSFDIYLSHKDIEVLVARYGEVVDGVVFFRYSEFMNDLRDADNPRIKKILEQIREKVAQRITGGRFEIRRAFRCFDRDGSGQITESEFKEMLVNYAIIVSDEDLHDLVKFIDSEGRGYVGYNDFIDKCLPKDYSGLASLSPTAFEKSPGTEKYSSPPTVKKPPQKLKAPVDVDAVISRLVDYVAQHRIRLSDFLKSSDSHNSGSISFDHFYRALTSTGFKIDVPEIEALAHRFSHPRYPATVDWVSFEQLIESNFVVPDLTRDPRTPNASYVMKSHSPVYSLQSLPEGTVKQLLSRISKDVYRNRIIPKQYFEDYDRSHISHITRSQFQRALSMTRIPMSVKDYEVLWSHFESQPDQVDYIQFCNLVSTAAA